MKLDNLRLLYTIGVMLVTAFCAHAQDLTIPQNDFTVFTLDSVTLEKGTAKKVEVWVLKSKQYSGRYVRMGINTKLPPGVLVNFQPSHGNFDYFEATISANPLAETGSFFMIISASTQRLTKGTLLKVNVIDPTITSKR